MSGPGQDHVPRILVVDDNPSIHQNFRKILGREEGRNAEINEVEAALFGEVVEERVAFQFVLDSAYQGQEALDLVKRALGEQRPYAMAFVDVRRPPGWDGIETLEQIWQVAPDLQAVICTAHSDYTWSEVAERLGHADSLLILKKPFETVEVLQMAHALTQKWALTQRAQLRMEDLDRLVSGRTDDLVEANEKLRGEIAQRARIQEALHGSEERFSTAFRSAPIPLAILRCRDRRFVDVNPAFASLLGTSREAVLDRTDLDLSVWSACGMDDGPVPSLSERSRSRRCKITADHGRLREALCSVEPITLDGEACGLLIVEDLSDLLELEAQLRQAQKMESIGLLAAGVAHEFNNILTVIQGNVNLLQMSETDSAEAPTAFEQIIAASQRAATLTSQLLAFSRKKALHQRPLDLSALVLSCENMLGKLLGEKYALHLQCAESLPSIQADENCLVQVLMNLVANARDATPAGGKINLRTARVVLDRQAASALPEARPGTYVTLSVQDPGQGIDPVMLDKVFDPLFTTKERGRGTGLGLSMVLGIVKQHQGWITAESQAGAGTIFTIYLPAEAGSAQAPPRESANPGDASELPRGDGEVVLVVEDEPPLRDLTCRVLQRNGYQVACAEDGRQALDEWCTPEGRLDLLLTDVAMPGGISGDQLARDLLAMRPGLKIICASGYSPGEVVTGVCRGLGAHFLQKPYCFKDLLHLVKRCLEDQDAVTAQV